MGVTEQCDWGHAMGLGAPIVPYDGSGSRFVVTPAGGPAPGLRYPSQACGPGCGKRARATECVRRYQSTHELPAAGGRDNAVHAQINDHLSVMIVGVGCEAHRQRHA
jgi:hypothetical protein